MTASTATVGDIELCYEEFGNPADPAVLLIMGIGAQMVFWRPEFCQQLADQGHRVIRFDNRDCGLSTKLDGVRAGGGSLIPSMAKFLAGVKITGTAYTLVDMAGDAAGLLDHLGIEQAHIVGASMGGMIAQVFAAEHPDRTATVSIIMSSNNQPFLPPPGPRQLMVLLKPPPEGASREQIIANSVQVGRIIGSPKYRQSPSKSYLHAAEYYDRSYYPKGFSRQFAAIMGTGSLAPFDNRITAPALVLHGKADKLMRPSGARAIARAIPGSRLALIDGMGHDLPEPLWNHIITKLTENFARSEPAAETPESEAAGR
ncbi:Probable lipase/esterase LipG [Mycobacteroides abscessus subsp. bolletii]|uniref:alpha/beta fold hydrolase n=1 Tax=Mycobacteroides abscessus TaxID=36809 RepID=UPI00092943B3|nr:alpha/beta hydrolase [Mycobacteroides abscessus]SHO89646.1 Probable lipase/esterase LipG [Mycobacteroides abscessus subsp. bolletii]SHR43738.1 Probable lipase/esterase LipG [Mycobacteroides abscessus subsp. bolletii]SHR64858.1 Probable lipase/esterase LipG [Mycobacteroides abscessus subsp. bolletii]SHS23773.1 Probable lipase/esterase LipG [Mycobacteroides abscessus subsp. bolletii]SHX19872.1 Probable lipase/esterase LipG [Mycobacteroides abscessus subsp. bolletii]